MNDKKYQDIWLLLNKFNFHIDLSTYVDLTCIICNKIMTNAYQSPCACRYCRSCIENYLNDSKKSCPGKFDDCKTQMINFENDLQFDHVANKKISLIVVKCPEPFCQFTEQLCKIMTHIESHQFKCPYIEMGCSYPRIDVDSIKKHLNDDLYEHTLLLLESNQNLFNEIDCVKNDVIKKEIIINELSSANRVLKDTMTSLKQINMKEMKTIKEQMQLLQIKINSLEKDSEKKQDSINALQVQVNGMELTKKGFDEYRNFPLFKPLQNDIDSYECSEIFSSRQDSSSDDSSILDESYTESSEESNPLNIDNKERLKWRISDYEGKRNKAIKGKDKAIFSKPFYTHNRGYKMKLRINPAGFAFGKDTHLSVTFGIISGEFDNELPWPMRKKITLALIDQTSGDCHTTYKYQYDSTKEKFRDNFTKPSTRTKNKNIYYFGRPAFIKSDLLINNDRLCRNGSIVLKCFVE